MRLFSRVVAVLALMSFASGVHGGVEIDEANITSIPLPSLGGWVLAPDGSTLIVSCPQSAEVVWIDTVAGKELRRVAVDFQPMALALRNEDLFATGKGSSMLYALDSGTGKLKKEIKVPGEKLAKLACHPTNGPLFATNDGFEVLSINPATEKITKTQAEGNFLATDPHDTNVLYTGTQKPMKDSLVFSRGPGNSVRVGVARSNRNSTVVKYQFKKEMKPVSVNENAAINASSLVVSPDGKKFAMVGAGGIQSESGKRTYAIAVFGSDDLTSQLGQVETGAYPTDIAFHPTLDLGAAEKRGGELTLFSTRSFAPLTTWQAPKGTSDAETHLLTFAAQGSKLIYYRPGPKTPGRSPKSARPKKGAEAASETLQAGLFLMPLVLDDDQKAKLEKTRPGVAK